MVLQLTVKNKFKSNKTGYEYYTIVDDFANEASIKCAYICDELKPGDRCLFKVSAGCYNGRGYLIFNFLHVLNRAAQAD